MLVLYLTIRTLGKFCLLISNVPKKDKTKKKNYYRDLEIISTE